MRQEASDACREHLTEIWSSWPEANEVPAAALAHAQSCLDCRRAVAELRSLCGRPPRWRDVLPASYWDRRAAATLRALSPRPRADPRLRWFPAFCCAAALAALLARRAPPPRVPLDVPVEAVENRGLLEHLDLLRNWDAAQASADAGGGR